MSICGRGMRMLLPFFIDPFCPPLMIGIVNMQKNWRDFLRFLRFIATRFSQDNCLQIAASLTFTTLLSLVPLITIALAMFSAFPVFEEYSAQIKVYLLNNLMPEMAGRIITQYMQQFADSAARLTAVGIAFLAVTAMSMMLTIDHAFNIIWRAVRPRPLLNRLVVYWAVLTLAPLLIGASLSLTSWVVGFSMGYAGYVPVFGVGVLKMLPLLFATLAFGILFRLVPNCYVPHIHALVGALVAAIVFESMNRIFGYYISHFPTYKLVYGAFASVPIFLMWIYLSWLAILLGAVIAASLSHWRDSTEEHLLPAAQLLDALRLLQMMARDFQQGRVASFAQMSRSLHVGYDALERLLVKLASINIVRRAEGSGWLLMRDVGNIRAGELLNLFVLDRGTLRELEMDESIQQWFAGVVEQLDQSSDLSLQELFARSAA